MPLTFRRLARFGATATALASLMFAGGATAAHADTAAHRDSGAVSYWFANSNWNASENVGQYPILIKRSDASSPGVICWGATNVSSSAGINFDHVSGTQVQFGQGQTDATVYLPIHDQGINGPARLARAYMYSCGGNTHVQTPNQQIRLLQNDPLDPKDPANPLGYQNAPTNGDPLQFVDWYVFGTHSPAGAVVARSARAKPGFASRLRVISNTPGSLSYRFWMWNQPAHSLAMTVERYLAQAEDIEQPGSTIQLSTYSLIHGACQNPSAIRKRYEGWIKQLANGIGNFRVVLYLEEDSLLETHCLTHRQLKVREQELAYAVRTLSVDPHVLIYLDAGAPDAFQTPRQMARLLRASDIAQAAGFAVNSTHHEWTTTDIRYGQRIARLTGGKHFIVNTSGNGRGPKLNRHPEYQGIEDLCNPPGRGLGPLSWNTGYRYLDGLLWYNNPGNSTGNCGRGEPETAKFWPAYALGLVKRWVNRVTGPHYNLIHSATDM